MDELLGSLVGCLFACLLCCAFFCFACPPCLLLCVACCAVRCSACLCLLASLLGSSSCPSCLLCSTCLALLCVALRCFASTIACLPCMPGTIASSVNENRRATDVEQQLSQESESLRKLRTYDRHSSTTLDFGTEEIGLRPVCWS